MKKIRIIGFVLIVIIFFAGCRSGKEKGDFAKVQNKEEVQKEQLPEEEKQENKSAVLITPEEKKELFLSEKINAMTTEEKIGQLFFLAYRKDENGQPILQMNPKVEKELKQYQPGGIILFGENIDTKEQTKQLIADYQASSKLPLFIGVDEEGGRVSRLHASGKIKAAEVPTAEEIGKTKNPEEAYLWYTQIAQELLELGFQVDFAPIADINTNPNNPVIGNRAFGSDAQLVAKMVVKAIQGLQDNGISASMKHFPGHGDTSTDTHTEETMIEHSLERMESVEWIPFAEGIKNGVHFIMVAHIKTPNITNDGLPASMSKEIVQKYLRGKLGYDGIVITDALDMGAIAQYYNSGDVAVKAVEAGVDMLLMPEDVETAFSALKKAVEQGTISEEKLNETVKRILSLKYDKGMLEERNISD